MKISPMTGGRSFAGVQVNQPISAEPGDATNQRNPNAIVMKTNRTVLRNAEAPIQEEEEEKNPEIAISDPSVQATEVPEATGPLSPQFAALAKQRRTLQVKEREIAEREKLLSGPSRAELEAKIKKQPLSVLQELGVTYEQLTNDILSSQGGINPDIQSLKDELKALKEGVDKTLSDKDAAAEKAVLMEMRKTVNQLSAEGEDFEMIRETQSQPDVIELIHRTYKETGEILGELEAMKIVEEELVTDALKKAKYKKVQGRLMPQPQLQQQPETGIRTLTNKHSANPVMDRHQRAMLAARNLLKR